MKRPVLIAAIGLIIGIIWGLYFKIVLFLLAVGCIYIIQIVVKNRFIKIAKVLINKKVLITFLIAFLIGNVYIKYLEQEYSKIYTSLEKVKCIGTIISDEQEKDYTYSYILRLEEINDKKIKPKSFIITIAKKHKTHIKYGDKISFEGEYVKPNSQRNYKGFDYSKYLKTKGIYGNIKINSKINIIKSNNLNIIFLYSNSIRNKIIKNINILFPEKTKGLFLGILIGYDNYISDDIKEDFSDSNLSHLLAVSGTHVSYVILGLLILFKFLKIPKIDSKILASVLLVFYLYIIGFTPSVTRAVIMCIISIMQSIVNRKQDIVTTISLSSLLIIISNPYKIFDIGFLLSYAGTIGIMAFINNFDNIKKDNVKIKLLKVVKNMLYVTISAQILIFPVIIYYFNTISLTFFISNIIAGLIIGPIIIGGLIIIVISFLNIKITAIMVKLYNVLLLILLKTTEIISKMSLSKIYIKTPSIIKILIYYFIIFIIISYIIIRKSKRYYLNKVLDKLILNTRTIIKNSLTKISIIFLLCLIIFFFLNKMPQKLKIYFIDVGQGDCTLITTPMNKKILIDSGGSETYDVGKKILFPYLLDRGINKIDYVIISHFDTDHCKSFEYIMKNMSVENVVISKQPEDSENYREFLRILKTRKINVIIVNKGDKLYIEKDLYFYTIWPDKDNFISENMLNNNSIVCKLIYKEFACIFTGDIEKIAEERILKQYENNTSILKSTILKVAHHGSKSSSIQEMLDKIKPEIALIGVGENNKFGHPNDEVLDRLKYIRN